MVEKDVLPMTTILKRLLPPRLPKVVKPLHDLELHMTISSRS